MKHISKLSRILILLSILFVGYGELARILKIYFFWESSQVGVLTIVITIYSLIGDLLTYKFKKYKYGFDIIKVLLTLFWIIIRVLFYLDDKQSEVFQSAETYINNSKELKAELGNFKIGKFHYKTELNTIQIGNQSSGEAKFGFILKGENKYKDFEISLIKNPEDTNWRINKKQ